MSHKMANTFARLHKSFNLIANLVKGAVTDMRQFLATESP